MSKQTIHKYIRGKGSLSEFMSDLIEAGHHIDQVIPIHSCKDAYGDQRLDAAIVICTPITISPSLLQPGPVTSTTTAVNCEVCGTTFVAKNADLKRGWAKACSKSCATQKRKIKS